MAKRLDVCDAFWIDLSRCDLISFPQKMATPKWLEMTNELWPYYQSECNAGLKLKEQMAKKNFLGQSPNFLRGHRLAPSLPTAGAANWTPGTAMFSHKCPDFFPGWKFQVPAMSEKSTLGRICLQVSPQMSNEKGPLVV